MEREGYTIGRPHTQDAVLHLDVITEVFESRCPEALTHTLLDTLLHLLLDLFVGLLDSLFIFILGLLSEEIETCLTIDEVFEELDSGSSLSML